MSPETTLLGEILSLPPRLASRTIAQVQASQHLLSMILCARSDSDDDQDAGGQDSSDEVAVPEPARSAEHVPEPVDVLSILNKDSATPTEIEPSTASGTDVHQDPVSVAPPAADLPIPGYDSLAASQVVPRLTTLSEPELDAIGTYEAAHRGRRTILNRVTQLQGP